MRAVRVGGAALVFAAVVSALAWPRLPALVPPLPGGADAAPRLQAALEVPLALLALTVLQAVLGRRLRARLVPAAASAGEAALCWGLALLAALHALRLGGAVGAWHAGGRVGAVLLGLFGVGVGNVLGKVRRNWLVGIRTPWALASAHVWRRTHRTAAWMMCVGGALAVVLAPVLEEGVAWRASVALLVAPVGAASVLSWVYWRGRGRLGSWASLEAPHPGPLPGGEGER